VGMVMKLFFMLVRRVPPVASPVLAEVFDILTRRGFEVESGISEEMLIRPELLSAEHDLYILKSHTELSKSLAGIVHLQGGRLLNPYFSCVFTQDKIMAMRIFRDAKIPAPRSWVTGDLAMLKPVAREAPLLIKPYLGHRGLGLRMIENPDELDALPPPETPVLIQEYIRGTGEDLKIYVVGDRVFGTKKPFSPESFTKAGRPCDLSPEIIDIAVRCGEAFGLGLYGLDVLESPQGPVVVDLNYFPGYKGIPGIAPVIAEYIEQYALGKYTLKVPVFSGYGDGGFYSCLSDFSMSAKGPGKDYCPPVG
jgi:ribosomal protein S6--L-glutamate ligase